MYVFVDTPIEVCDERDPSVGIDRLRDLRQSYLDTMHLIKQPILIVESSGSIEAASEALIEKYEQFTKVRF